MIITDENYAMNLFDWSVRLDPDGELKWLIPVMQSEHKAGHLLTPAEIERYIEKKKSELATAAR